MSKIIIKDAYIDHAIHFYYTTTLQDKPKYDKWERQHILNYLAKGYPVRERNGMSIVEKILKVKLKERELSRLIGVTKE